MKIALGLEYCGTQYSGWQRQKHTHSIQACVEGALSSVADETIQVHCAGRTDAGVHALHQVIHFETKAERDMRGWVMGSNVHLPSDISVLWAQPASEDFHARYSALSRTYRYLILNRPLARPGLNQYRVTWEYRLLDLDRMQRAAQCLIGEHDFSSFRAVECQSNSPMRNVMRLEICRNQDQVTIEIEANAFLHHMVRNIAGVLMDIGAGKAPVTWTTELLELRDRKLGGVTAAPHGLYLVQVNYPERYSIPGPPVSK